MARAYLVVRIKGQADVPHWAETTLRLFKLEKKYRATILPSKENTLGMLNKVKHYVAWNEIDSEIATELLEKKGRKSGYRRISESDLVKTEYGTIGGLATALVEGRVSMNKAGPLKPWFALAPPRHGFKKSTKRMYGEKGILGQNKDLATLVRSMM